MPRTGISSGTLRSVVEYGLPLPFKFLALEMVSLGKQSCNMALYQRILYRHIKVMLVILTLWFTVF